MKEYLKPFDPCLTCRFESGQVTPDEFGKITECPFTRAVDYIVNSDVFAKRQKGTLINRLRKGASEDPSNSFYYCPVLQRYDPYNPEKP